MADPLEQWEAARKPDVLSNAEWVTVLIAAGDALAEAYRAAERGEREARKLLLDQVAIVHENERLRSQLASSTRLQQASAENERLRAALERIDGGDYPCTDERQLRRWAYEALTGIEKEGQRC